MVWTVWTVAWSRVSGSSGFRLWLPGSPCCSSIHASFGTREAGPVVVLCRRARSSWRRSCSVWPKAESRPLLASLLKTMMFPAFIRSAAREQRLWSRCRARLVDGQALAYYPCDGLFRRPAVAVRVQVAAEPLVDRLQDVLVDFAVPSRCYSLGVEGHQRERCRFASVGRQAFRFRLSVFCELAEVGRSALLRCAPRRSSSSAASS